MIVNIVNITFVVSPGLCTVLYSVSRVCRVHHLNMITSYKLGVREGQTGYFSAGSDRLEYFPDVG